MKSIVLGGLLAVGVSFVGIASGHPFYIKRALVTDVVFVTETIADAIVYVDENGVPYSTTSIGRAAPVATAMVESDPTSALPVPASTIPAAPVSSELPSSAVITPDAVSTSTTLELHPPEPNPIESSSSYVAPPQAPASSASILSQALQTQSDSGDRFPLGVTYDPYKGGQNAAICKSNDEITAELAKMNNFGIFRIYGNDCGIIPIAVQSAKKQNQKIMAGIYLPNQNIDNVVNALSTAVKEYAGGNWDIISLVSVENEKVNDKTMTASDTVDSIEQAREALQDAGYYGPIGAVETVPAITDNPSICSKSDMALVNIHAFFDPNTKAEDAGKFVKGQVEQVRNACPNKRVVVTESGWPHQGQNHDQAVVSPDAQKKALDSIRAEFDHDLFLFNAFDSPWKTDNAYTYEAERWWGFL